MDENKQTRNLIPFGQSFGITLPIDWVRKQEEKMGVAKIEEVEIEVLEDKLIITPIKLTREVLGDEQTRVDDYVPK